MEKATTYKTTSYNVDGVYMIDIVETETVYEAWMYVHNYVYKMLMFGMPLSQQSLDEFITIVEQSIDENIQLYEDLINGIDSYYLG